MQKLLQAALSERKAAKLITEGCLMEVIYMCHAAKGHTSVRATAAAADVWKAAIMLQTAPSAQLPRRRPPGRPQC